MKILHLIDSGGLYGAEKMLLTLVAEQVRGGLSPLILSVGVPGITEKALEVEARRLGLPLKVWRMKPGLNFREALHIARWAKSENFQIFHSHGYKFNILLGLLPKLLRKIPVVTTLHGYTSTKKYTKMWINELLDRYALTRVDRVVLVRQGMSEVLGKRIQKKSSLCVIENGIDCSASDDNIKFALSNTIESFLNQPGPVVCAVGRLSPEKGFPLLIEAISKLQSLHDQIKLIILGEGGMRNEIENKVRFLKIEDRVLMPGYIDNPIDIMKRCTLIAMPSYTEGLPVTLLEALKIRCPIVASAVGGIPDLLEGGDAGWLVQPGDALCLANAIDRLLKSPTEAREKADRGYNLLLRRYSAEKMASRYTDVYRNLL